MQLNSTSAKEHKAFCFICSSQNVTPPLHLVLFFFPSTREECCCNIHVFLCIRCNLMSNLWQFGIPKYHFSAYVRLAYLFMLCVWQKPPTTPLRYSPVTAVASFLMCSRVCVPVPRKVAFYCFGANPVEHLFT